MANSKVWDIVKVPFPYVEKPVREQRPALVVASNLGDSDHPLLWVLMITSAENRAWPTDVPVSDLQTAGLPVASVIRTAKIATIEAKEAQVLGTLNIADRGLVTNHLRTTFTILQNLQ